MVSRAGHIFQRDVEEKVFTGLTQRQFFANRTIVRRAVLDRLVEYGRVRGKSRHREFVNVALQRSAIKQITRDVVQPYALSEVVEQLCSFHFYLLIVVPKGSSILTTGTSVLTSQEAKDTLIVSPVRRMSALRVLDRYSITPDMK